MQGAGIDGIARGVGLTGAALYTHFASKQEFLCAVLREEMGASARRFLSADASLDQVLAHYLSLPHTRVPAAGCALPAITGDVARADAPVRDAFAAGFAEIVDALAGKAGNRGEALGILAAAVGAVTLARALPDDAAALEVLTATRALVTAALAAGPHAPMPEAADRAAGGEGDD